jgi:hypothetical protein
MKTNQTELSDKFRPKNQSDCDHANALREYEAAHKKWMQAGVFTDAGRQAKREMESAREKLTTAAKAAHPTWIV